MKFKMNSVSIKRIYDPFSPEDGLRVLVDRLWPRGIRKENVKIDLWMKDLAPSPGLRKWFKHDPDKWEAFVSAYEKELTHNKALLSFKEQLKLHKKITLLYAAKDSQHNHAQALKNFLH